MTATGRPPRMRSRYGSVYSPDAGSSRWDPARWQSPSRSATRPPSEPTFEEARVEGGGRLGGRPRRGRVRSVGGGAWQTRQPGGGEDSEGRGRGGGRAGGAGRGGAFDPPQSRGVAGRARHAVHRQRAEFRHNP